MLQATVLESPSDLLACRPDIGRLLSEDGIRDDLTRLAPPRRPGLWAMGHLLTHAAGGPCGLVSLYAIAQSPRTLVLGPMSGRLVIGKRRTLAALAVIRHLMAYPDDWDELLIAGGGPESRRFDTAARCCRLRRRLVATPDSVEPLLVISAAPGWRQRWAFRRATDRTLLTRWRVNSWLPTLESDIAFSVEQATGLAATSKLMLPPPHVEGTAVRQRSIRRPSTGPNLRIVSSDD